MRTRLVMRRLLSSAPSSYSSTVRLPKTAFPAWLKAERRRKMEEELAAEEASLYRDQDAALPSFTLLDGPPYANGDLHVGHAINKLSKDFILRYQMAAGRRVVFRPGWDTHGLPIELKANPDGRLKDPMEIRRAAAALAMETVVSQAAEFRRWGVMGEWERPYLTLQKYYEAAEVELLQNLLRSGQLYRSFYPVHWSPSSRTALANAEVEYDPDHRSTAVWFRLRLVNRGQLPGFRPHQALFAVVFTTTPWTLPLNDACSFNPGLTYVLVTPGGGSAWSSKEEPSPVYLLAKDRLEDFATALGKEFRVLGELGGEGLEGLEYVSPWWGDHTRPFLPGAHVSAAKGSGLVHSAFAHGAEDFALAKAHGEEVRCWVDEDGCFTRELGPQLSYRSVLEDGGAWVLDKGRLRKDVLAASPIQHSYPIDWRTKKPLITRASLQWFLDLGGVADAALKALSATSVVEHGTSGGRRELERNVSEAPPWCLSRQRVWGVPLPFFYRADDSVVRCDALDAHLLRLIRDRGSDVWWTASDEELFPLEMRAEAGLGPDEVVTKGKDVADVWFDSGVAWRTLEEGGQADVVLEGLDQYRGWFRSLLLTSVAAGAGGFPAKALVCHGFSVDEAGRKMSKSDGNVVSPREVTEGRKGAWKGAGVDGLRLWVAAFASGVQKAPLGAEVMERLGQRMRNLRLPLRFVLGVTSDLEPDAEASQAQMSCATDRWALGCVGRTVEEAERAWAAYDVGEVWRLLARSLDAFSAGYFLMAKDRLYCAAEDSPERRSAQLVLRALGDSVVGLAGPVLPHLASEYAHHRGRRPQLLRLREALDVWKADESLMRDFDRWAQPLRAEVMATSGGSFAAQKLRLELRLRDPVAKALLEGLQEGELEDLLGVSEVALSHSPNLSHALTVFPDWELALRTAQKRQCPRCRRFACDEESGHESLCQRCEAVLK